MSRFIPREQPLLTGKTVYLRVQIAPFDRRTILEDAGPFPPQDKLEEAYPELKGQPVPLEATLFSGDVEINDGERTQKMTLIYGQPTETLYYQIRPLKSGPAALRLCVYYRNHLLQSLSISVSAADTEGIAGVPQKAVVETAYSLDFRGAAELPARKVWLGINEAAAGTHNLYVKSDNLADQVSLNQDLLATLNTALDKARRRFWKCPFSRMTAGLISTATVLTRITGRVRMTGQPLPEAKAQSRFTADMANLASAGHLLYNAVFKGVQPAEVRETMEQRLEAFESCLENEEEIQITRLKHLEDIWPWALMYTLPVNMQKVREVCLAFRRPDGSVLSYNACHAACRHPALQTEAFFDTVICPYGFWGFKHIIEQPTQPGDKAAQDQDNLTREIRISGRPVFDMPVADNLIQYAGPHLNIFEHDYQFRILKTAFDVYQAFKQPPEPHMIYFFCHGAQTPEGPGLIVGNDEQLLATGMTDWKFKWSQTHPLVFINGCGTVEMKPEHLAAIMTPSYVRAPPAIIGTEVTVYTYLATEFAEKFFRRLLTSGAEDAEVGKIIKALRLELLAKYNPLGLVYTPYCSADLKIVNE